MAALETPVWTWLPGSADPVEAGVFRLADGKGRFVYSEAYMGSAGARPLDPLNLRFSRKHAGVPVHSKDGLPGVFLDAAPAGYGADRLIARSGKSTMTALELLEAGPPDGVGAIEVCGDIERKLAWRPHTLDELAARVRDLEEDARHPVERFDALMTTKVPAPAASGRR